MARRPTVLLVALPHESYVRLEQQALLHDRDPIQQARWLLKPALKRRTANPESTDHHSRGPRLTKNARPGSLSSTTGTGTTKETTP